MEKFFKLKEHGTTVRTEIVGGLTTFFAMAYIMFVNPNILCVDLGNGFYPAMPGENWTAVLVATCVSAALGTFLTAFLANVPFAQAPGMGLNAFFTYTVCLGMGYTWQQALVIVLFSGILFLAVAVSPLRSKIIASIPACLKAAISAGIGLFITIIGLLNVKLITFSAGVPALNFKDNMPGLLAIIGLIIMAILLVFKVKGNILIGIIAATIIGIPLGVTTLPESLTMSGITLAPVAFHFDFAGAFSKGILPLFTAVISFALVDCFDTVGTLIGTAGNADMLDKDGNLPNGDKALIADAIATCTGACLGTSTVTTYVESSTGISEGARTGLSSVVVGVLFLLSVLIAPVAGIVPAAATAPALIIVGVLMIGSVGKIVWSNLEDAIPCFLTIAMMPFAYSISDGIGFGFISWTLIKLVRGKGKEVPVLMYVISVLFLVKYILTNIG
ncbi:MAG: NCS2 family permease [Oscillospiraceae bacterium]|nr:NCS2 family permease [Oscillospiraceae bacterium]